MDIFLLFFMVMQFVLTENLDADKKYQTLQVVTNRLTLDYIAAAENDEMIIDTEDSLRHGGTVGTTYDVTSQVSLQNEKNKLMKTFMDDNYETKYLYENDEENLQKVTQHDTKVVKMPTNKDDSYTTKQSDLVQKTEYIQYTNPKFEWFDIGALETSPSPTYAMRLGFTGGHSSKSYSKLGVKSSKDNDTLHHIRYPIESTDFTTTCEFWKTEETMKNNTCLTSEHLDHITIDKSDYIAADTTAKLSAELRVPSKALITEQADEILYRGHTNITPFYAKDDFSNINTKLLVEQTTEHSQVLAVVNNSLKTFDEISELSKTGTEFWEETINKDNYVIHTKSESESIPAMEAITEPATMNISKTEVVSNESFTDAKMFSKMNIKSSSATEDITNLTKQRTNIRLKNTQKKTFQLENYGTNNDTEVYYKIQPNELLALMEGITVASDQTAWLRNLTDIQRYVASEQLSSTNFTTNIKIGLHYNPVFKYGVRQKIVLSIETTPKVDLLLSLSTSNYLIDFFITHFYDIDKQKFWKHTNFLGQELLRSGIQESNPLPFQRGYYRVISATFWEIGDHKLTLRITDPMDISRIYAMEARNINVTRKHKLMCYPKLNVLDCGSPADPTLVILGNVMQFVVKMDEPCGAKRHSRVNWKLYNLAETDLLKHFGKSKHFEFFTKFDHSIVKPGNVYLLLRVDTVIRNIHSVARCYLYVPPPQLFPVIIGGSKQLITGSMTSSLDGSLSKDYSMPNIPIQAENLEWYCLSLSDPKNGFCKQLHKSAVKLKIPAHSLRLGKTYQIFLKVRSKLFPFITKNTRQTLQVIKDVVYTPHILCRYNCEFDQYIPSQHVHLEAQCFNCPKQKRVAFEWFLNGKPHNFILNSGNQQHFVSFLKDNKQKRSNIKLKMKVGRKSYQYEMNLKEYLKPDVSVCHAVDEYQYNSKELYDRRSYSCEEWWYDYNYYQIIDQGTEARGLFILTCWWGQEPYVDQQPTHSAHHIYICGYSDSEWDRFLKAWWANWKYDFCKPYCDYPRSDGVRKPRFWDYVYNPSGPWDYRAETVGDPPVPVAGDYTKAYMKVRMPESTQVNITSCNVRDECVSKIVNLDVKPVHIESTLSSFKEFLTDWRHKTDLQRELYQYNNWQAGFVIAYTAAKKTNTYELLNYLYSQMKDYQTRTKMGLEQMMFLTNTLLSNFRDNIDYRCADIFAEYFLKTAINMDILAEANAKIKHRRYNYLEDTLLNMTASFTNAREKHMQAMCNPSNYICNKGRDYAEYYDDLGTFDPLITTKLVSWLHCALNLVRNIHMLGAIAADSLPNDVYPIKKSKQNVFMVLTLIKTNNNRHVEIESLDNLTKIYISRKLIDELADKLLSTKVIIQLVTQPNENGLFWWYPQPIPMSSSVLFVYALSNKRRWLDRIVKIDNPLVFETNATKPNNFTNEMIMTGILRSRLHIHTYKLIVAPKSVLVANILSNNKSMVMLIKLHHPPSGREVRDHGCNIPVNSTMRRIRFSNKCDNQSAVFISVMPPIAIGHRRYAQTEESLGEDHKLKKPLNYSFTLEIYECTDWVDRDHSPGWTANHCVTIVDPDLNYTLRCSCYGLGAFSPRIYPAFAKLQSRDPLDSAIGINWILIILYFLLLLLLLYVLFTYMGSVQAHEKETLISCVGVKKGENLHHGEDVLIIICTGGKTNAGTSSNVTFNFKSEGRPEVSYNILQDPQHPKLKRNSTCTLKLGNNAIKLPTKLKIDIERQGRYPSWYCRTVTIQDLKRDTRQLFKVNRWIRNGSTEWMESDFYSTPKHHVEPYAWNERMRTTFEENFLNWFLFQPILGPWLSGTNACNMNRYERSCVWICKLAACIAIAAFYFGVSSREKHNIDKQQLTEITLNFKTVFIVAVLCYLGCIAYDLIFHVVIMRIILRRY